MPDGSFGASAMQGSIGASLRSGFDGKHSKVSDIKEPIFKRDLTKNEAGIMPDKGSSIRIADKKQKQAGEQNAYEKQINSRIKPEDGGQSFPRVTFAAQEMFNEADTLSKKVPTWSKEFDNPINFFVPNVE